MQDDRLYDEKELEKSWLISYSDLFTLLFVIIVIIAALHSAKIKQQVDEANKEVVAKQASIKEIIASKDVLELQKLKLQREIELLTAKRNQLAGADNTPATAQASQAGNGQKTAAEQEKAAEQVAANEQDAGRENRDTVRMQLAATLSELSIDFEETEEGLMVRLPEKIAFASGSAELSEEGKEKLAALAGVLQRFPQLVRIEGYTDDVPIAHSPYHSNWELAAARAVSVMRELVDQHGLPASRFTLAGWGDYKPLVDNSNEENRAKNRRVEIVILAKEE